MQDYVCDPGQITTGYLDAFCLSIFLYFYFGDSYRKPTIIRMRFCFPATIQAKCEAMKSCILAMLNGEKFPRVMMTVIRFCVNTESKELKKLLTLYWEVNSDIVRLKTFFKPHSTFFDSQGFSFFISLCRVFHQAS